MSIFNKKFLLLTGVAAFAAAVGGFSLPTLAEEEYNSTGSYVGSVVEKFMSDSTSFDSEAADTSSSDSDAMPSYVDSIYSNIERAKKQRSQLNTAPGVALATDGEGPRERGSSPITAGTIGSNVIVQPTSSTSFTASETSLMTTITDSLDTVTGALLDAVQPQSLGLLTISDLGLAVVKNREGFNPNCYDDGAGYSTIGYGTAFFPQGAGCPYDNITEEFATQLLMDEIREKEQCVRNVVSVELTQWQFDALVSFMFNLGCYILDNTQTLAYINSGQFTAAADNLLQFCKAGDTVWEGLVDRREAERALFLGYMPDFI